MDWIKKTTLIVSIVLVSGFLIYATSTESKNKITHEGTARYFPTSIDFAGEQAPLQISNY